MLIRSVNGLASGFTADHLSFTNSFDWPALKTVTLHASADLAGLVLQYTPGKVTNATLNCALAGGWGQGTEYCDSRCYLLSETWRIS